MASGTSGLGRWANGGVLSRPFLGWFAPSFRVHQSLRPAVVTTLERQSRRRKPRLQSIPRRGLSNVLLAHHDEPQGEFSSFSRTGMLLPIVGTLTNASRRTGRPCSGRRLALVASVRAARSSGPSSGASARVDALVLAAGHVCRTGVGPVHGRGSAGVVSKASLEAVEHAAHDGDQRGAARSATSWTLPPGRAGTAARAAEREPESHAVARDSCAGE